MGKKEHGEGIPTFSCPRPELYIPLSLSYPQKRVIQTPIWYERKLSLRMFPFLTFFWKSAQKHSHVHKPILGGSCSLSHLADHCYPQHLVLPCMEFQASNPPHYGHTPMALPWIRASSIAKFRASNYCSCLVSFSLNSTCLCVHCQACISPHGGPCRLTCSQCSSPSGERMPLSCSSWTGNNYRCLLCPISGSCLKIIWSKQN